MTEQSPVESSARRQRQWPVLVFAAMLLLLGLEALNRFVGTSSLPEALTADTRTDRDEPDSRATDIRYQIFDKQGELRYRVQAATMLQFLDDRQVQLTSPYVALRAGLDTTWNIQAKRGTVLRTQNDRDEVEDEMRLVENILVTRSQGPQGAADLIELRGSTLTVWPQRQQAQSTNPITVTTSLFRTEAPGLEIDLNSNVLRFPARSGRRVITRVLL